MSATTSIAQYRPRKTILIAEADPLLMAMTAGALERAGFSVLAVASAEEALGFAFMDVPFNALFTGIELGGALDGWDLAEALRDMRPDLPVIYACANQEAQGSVMRVSESGWVPKPYSPIAIGVLMRDLLEPQPTHRPDIAPADPSQTAQILPFRRRA